VRLDQDARARRRIKWIGPVPDGYREALYRSALFFAFPSIYEGFGIPVLDALVCGCPVLVSGIGSLREICGDAALYVDPMDIGSIAEGLQRLLTDAPLRLDLAARGAARLPFFTLEREAAALTEVYREAVRLG